MAERTGGRRHLSDRIVLANMRFDGKHGYHEWELQTLQPFEVDVEKEPPIRVCSARREQ